MKKQLSLLITLAAIATPLLGQTPPPPPGLPQFYAYPVTSVSNIAVDGDNYKWFNPGGGNGYFTSISDLPGISLNPGQKLTINYKLQIGADVNGTSTNHRFVLVSYADSPAGTKPMSDLTTNDLPGEEAYGYGWWFPFGQLTSGTGSLNVQMRKRNFDPTNSAHYELMGRSGTWQTRFSLSQEVAPVNFEANGIYTIIYSVELVDIDTAVLGLTILNENGDPMGSWTAVDTSNPNTTFDTFAYRDGGSSSSASPHTIMEFSATVSDGNARVIAGYVVDAGGYIYTDSFLGTLYAEEFPWLWSVSMEKWFYSSSEDLSKDGAWMYYPR